MQCSLLREIFIFHIFLTFFFIHLTDVGTNNNVHNMDDKNNSITSWLLSCRFRYAFVRLTQLFLILRTYHIENTSTPYSVSENEY